eukprot:11182328-Lingulodinium_polyedra.AAC.1
MPQHARCIWPRPGAPAAIAGGCRGICLSVIVGADPAGMTVWLLRAPSGDEHSTRALGCKTFTLLDSFDSRTLVVK